jgi:hypothetical protein
MASSMACTIVNFKGTAQTTNSPKNITKLIEENFCDPAMSEANLHAPDCDIRYLQNYQIGGLISGMTCLHAVKKRRGDP